MNVKSFRAVIRQMKTVDQIPGKQTVWEHGVDVTRYYQDLLRVLRGEEAQLGWKFPEWVVKHRQELLALLPPWKTVRRYALYHDLGKPFCRVVDEFG